MKIKDLVVAAARRIGCEVIPTWRLDNYEFARYLRSLILERRISQIIDVGANTGQYRDFLRQHVGYSGSILSYEPHPESFVALRNKALSDRKWLVRNLALSSEPGELPLNVMKSTVFNSFLAPTDNHVRLPDSLNHVAHQIRVPVSTLDIEWERETIAGSVYLKLDTQGFDLNVLRGARQCLPQVAALQTELSVKPIYEQMPSMHEVMSFLADRGFAIGAAFPVSRDASGAVIEFDGVFVRP